MVFTGTYLHSIDAKHRLAIPAEIRALVERDPDRRADQPLAMYVMPGENKSLALYTEARFEKRAEEISNSPDQEAALYYAEVLFPLTHKVELDKQGRILLPEALLEIAEFKQDVVLIGMNDHIAVRDRVTWQEHIKRRLAAMPNGVMNPQRALSKREVPPTTSGGA